MQVSSQADELRLVLLGQTLDLGEQIDRGHRLSTNLEDARAKACAWNVVRTVAGMGNKTTGRAAQVGCLT